MSAGSHPVEYRPELLTRRGEVVAWSLTLLVAAGGVVLARAGYQVPGVLSFVGAFLLAIALSISLGNWMDRRTVIRIDADAIEYHNGLRNVRLAWDQIRQVQMLPSPIGNKVRVLGDRGHFDYRMLREVMLGGEVKGRTGFRDGERILKRILSASNLIEVPPPEAEREEARKAGAHYYARK